MTRLHRSLVALVCAAVVFSACSDDKKPSASSASSLGTASSSRASSSGPPVASSDTNAAAPTTTVWPLTVSPTSLGNKSHAAPSVEVCNRLSGAQLEAALGVAYPSAGGDNAACTYEGADGSSILLSLSAIEGDAATAMQRSQGRCDPGTAHTVDVGDGGYTCRVTGQPAAAVATGGSILRLVVQQPGSITPDKGEQGFAQLLGDLA